MIGMLTILVLVTALLIGHPQAAEPHQLRAGGIHPVPRKARGDVPAPLHEGCMIGFRGRRSGVCLYGYRRGLRTVILFGDSHALQYFPALQPIAKQNRWRLLVLTKRECTPAAVTIGNRRGRRYSSCNLWRQWALRRIERTGGRAVVALSSDTAYRTFRPRGGKRAGPANAKALERGYIATLKRIRRAGLATVVIRATPKPTFYVPDCVATHRHRSGACSFRQRDRWAWNFDLRAARRVGGTRLVDVTRSICRHGRCRAVIGNVLAYRDGFHLTATFARTLVPRLEPALKQALGR